MQRQALPDMEEAKEGRRKYMTAEQTQDTPKIGPVDSVEQIVVSADVLRVLCDATIRLAEIRQRGCSHLCVENFAPECLMKLIYAVTHNEKAEVSE